MPSFSLSSLVTGCFWILPSLLNCYISLRNQVTMDKATRPPPPSCACTPATMCWWQHGIIEKGETIDGVTASARIMRGHKIAADGNCRWPTHSQIRPDHRLCQERHCAPATGCTSTMSSWANWRHDYAFAQAAKKELILPESERADVPGLSPQERQGRHAQLHRHHDHVNCSATVAAHIAQRGRAFGHAQRLSQH